MKYRLHSKRRKKERQEEAEVRQGLYDSLSVAEKIKLAKSRRGESKRELDRLSRKTGG